MEALVVIDDAKAAAIIKDARIRQAFPCVANANNQLKQQPKRSGGCCGRRRGVTSSNSQATLFRSVKQCIANLRGGPLAEFKLLLNAQKIRVVAADGKGRLIKWTL